MPDRHPCRTVARLHRWILVISLVATVVGGYFTTKLGLESDLAALLPSSFPSVQALEAVEAEVGGATSTLRVVLTGTDFATLRSFAEELQPRLEANELVLNARFRNETEFYERNALLFLEPSELDSLHTAIERAIEEEKQEANPFMIDDLFGPPPSPDPAGGEAVDALAEWEARYEEEQPKPYFTNPDSSVLVVEVSAAEEGADLDFSRRFLAEVQGVVEATGPADFSPALEVLYGGNVKNRIDEFESLRSDIFGTALYGLTAVLILLLIYFRSVVAPLLIAISLLASLSWTFGVTWLLVGQLNTITGFLFVILFGLGIDYGIHAFARYREGRQAGLAVENSLHRMVCHTGRALTTTTLTTASAFFSLMLMDFRGFSELGLITGVGLLFALVAMLLLLPALVVASERLGLLRIAEVPGKTLTFQPRPFRPARGILIGTGIVTVLAALGFTQVSFQYDFTDLRFISAERERVSDLTDGVFTRSQSPALVLAQSREEAAMVEEVVGRRMAADTLTPTVDQVRSLESLIPYDQEARLERIRAIRTLIDEEDALDLMTGEDRERLRRLQGYLEVDEPVTLDDVPESEIRSFRTRSGEIGNFVFIYPDVPLRDGRNAILFSEDIGTLELPNGRVLHAASTNLIIADLLQMVIREGKLAVGLSLGIVFLIVWIDVRSLRSALLIVSPLVVGLVWMGGMMTLLGMKLNLFNMVVLPSVVGIGVDSAVHIHHRYRQEGPRSIYLVLARTGPAVAIATITTIVGYTGLILARHPGLNSIGYLAVLGLTAMLATALLALPALLDIVNPVDAVPTNEPDA